MQNSSDLPTTFTKVRLTAQQTQRARKSHILSGLSKVGMKHDLSGGERVVRAGVSEHKEKWELCPIPSIETAAWTCNKALL